MGTRKVKEKKSGSDQPVSARFISGAVGVMIPVTMSDVNLDDSNQAWIFFTYLIVFWINAAARTSVRAVFKSALVAFGDKMLVDPSQNDIFPGALAWAVVGAGVSIVAVWLTLLPVASWVHTVFILILMSLGVAKMVDHS